MTQLPPTDPRETDCTLSSYIQASPSRAALAVVAGRDPLETDRGQALFVHAPAGVTRLLQTEARALARLLDVEADAADKDTMPPASEA